MTPEREAQIRKQARVCAEDDDVDDRHDRGRWWAYELSGSLGLRDARGMVADTSPEFALFVRHYRTVRREYRKGF